MVDFSENFNEQISIGAKKNINVGGNVDVLDNWKVVHKDYKGNIKDVESFHNLVVNEGLDYALGTALNNDTPVATWYIGLTDGSPNTDATDTMGSHSGWTEITDYDESARQEWVSGSVNSQTITNSSNPGVFTINADGITVGGAFLVSDDSKGGTAGTLFAVGAFSKGDKSFDSGDTIEVTAQFSNST